MSSKKIFVASIATETNTFSPVPIDLNAFEQSFYAPPSKHPDTPTLCSGVFIACRNRVIKEGWQLIEGTAAWAEPAGIVNKSTWLKLKNEVLQQVKQAMPLDSVILGLHGAMVAQGEDDCEGSLLAAVRNIVGEDAVIAASFDPHSHLTQQRIDNADILLAFKEFPHTDFMATADNLVEQTIRTIKGEINPATSVFDCKMIGVFPTSLEPMRSFINKIVDIENAENNIVNISVIHGFMAGDVPSMGTKVIVTTDASKSDGDALARELGLELFGFRNELLPPFHSIENGLNSASDLLGDTPVVIADVWDNPGGGVAGDATLILQEIIDRKLINVGFATLWDPIAVSLCIAAGEGGYLDLRFGGKTAFNGGDPINAYVLVKKVVHDATQSFGDSVVPMGDCVCIEFQGIELILNSNRAQVFNPDLFSNMGIEPTTKDILVVKSTNHFHDAFQKITDKILYVDAGAPYPSNPKKTAYKKARSDIWPITDNPVHI